MIKIMCPALSAPGLRGGAQCSCAGWYTAARF